MSNKSFLGIFPVGIAMNIFHVFLPMGNGLFGRLQLKVTSLTLKTMRFSLGMSGPLFLKLFARPINRPTITGRIFILKNNSVKPDLFCFYRPTESKNIVKPLISRNNPRPGMNEFPGKPRRLPVPPHKIQIRLFHS